MAKLFSIRPSITFRGRSFKGLRGWAGKPLHPPLTDIPVAAYFLVALFDLLSLLLGPDSATGHDLYAGASWLLLAGFVVSIPTALTGFWDWLKSTAPHTQAWRTANWHMAVMLFVTVLVVVDVLMRRAEYADALSTPTSIMALTVAIGGLVAFGAMYGGALVYEYEFNVEQKNGWAWEKSEEDRIPGSPDPTP